ncbi:MAG: hypothetical protein D6706_19795 [Chloroflexi bacterium]|nr:MAG: hypothetical protein D6706_19795 [Chloroflexota bacterium]
MTMRDSRVQSSIFGFDVSGLQGDLPRKTLIGVILMVALIAFELFNFDTTQYALNNLIGDVRFLGLQWATILAIAFCSIDFAGLVRLFTPEKGMANEPREVWYLMGAWLLGATMNAIMTWWAISLTLLNHNFGNEVLSREQLLLYVPIFVAVLVWLTRILFIGAFTVAGEHIFDFSGAETAVSQSRPAHAPVRSTPVRQPQPMAATPQRTTVSRRQTVPPPPPAIEEEPEPLPQQPVRPTNSRIRQRPPMPRPNGVRRMPLNGVQARGRNRS